MIVCFALLVLGIGIFYWSAHDLRSGVEGERWSADEIAPFVSAVAHPLWKAVLLVLSVSMFASFIPVLYHHGRPFWCSFLLIQMFMQLSSPFARKVRENRTDARPDWAKFPPLTSDHWGER